MPLIELHTLIQAPPERCFQLSLSVDIHTHSTGQTGEKVVRGRTHGILTEGESITWRAKHFGITQDLTSKVHSFRPPNYFVSEMTEGAFKKIYHEHIFEPDGNGTMMIDKFDFEAPFGMIGKIVSAILLTRYMRRFLLIRNASIKQIAESGEWKIFLEQN